MLLVQYGHENKYWILKTLNHFDSSKLKFSFGTDCIGR